MGYLTVPLFLWGACPCALAINSGFLDNVSFVSSSIEGMKPPLNGQWGSLFWWVGVFCIREVDRRCHSSWHGGYLPISLPSLFGHANHDPVQWVVTFILGFTICQHQWALTSLPPPYVHVPSVVCSHITLPKVFTHLLWMLWWMSIAEVVTSHLSIQGKLCW